MNRKLNKMTLNRETLRTLDQTVLADALGGAVRPSPLPCHLSNRLTCGSCQATCTTNYC